MRSSGWGGVDFVQPDKKLMKTSAAHNALDAEPTSRIVASLSINRRDSLGKCSIEIASESIVLELDEHSCKIRKV